MEQKLYYTRQELFNQPHTNYVETDTNIMFTQDSSNFKYYKKLYLLKPNGSDIIEIYVSIQQYIVIKDYLLKSLSRWMKEFDTYVFYSMEDFKNTLDYACKHKLF